MRRVVDFDIVNLASNKWGNETMRQVANEWFAQHPDCQAVEIHEHGGWWLAWTREGECCGTANDCAQFPADAPRLGNFTGRDCRRPGPDGKVRP